MHNNVVVVAHTDVPTTFGLMLVTRASPNNLPLDVFTDERSRSRSPLFSHVDVFQVAVGANVATDTYVYTFADSQ